MKQRRMSQKELHLRSGVSISRINEYVKGKGGPPTLPTLSRLLDALGATRSDLFAETLPDLRPGESPIASLESRVSSLEEQHSFLEAEHGRLELEVQELKREVGVGSDEEASEDASAAN